MLSISKEKKYLAFVILIGGKSARFGTDKGSYKFLGKPFIMHQIETLSQFDYDIFLIAHSKQHFQTFYDDLNIPEEIQIIFDDKELISELNLQIPLIGLYSAFKELNKLGYKKAFIISCDMPLIKYDVVKYLIKNSKGFDCCIPKWKNGYLEPLFAIYSIKKGFHNSLENLENKKFKLIKILNESWKINYIPIEEKIQILDRDLKTFLNINEPQDINKLKEFYREEL